jgi:molybdopterin-guanine dinucleotide biosynthesis protein A
MAKRFEEVSALVLTGGGSRRMQRDKAELPLPGGTLLETILAQLQPHFPEIIICSSRRGNHRSNGIRTVLDTASDHGPLMGILTGLRAARFSRAFVMAGDMPVVHVPLIRRLLAEADADVVVPRVTGGRMETLFAVYSRSVIPAIDEILAEGSRSVLDLYPRCRTRILPVTDMDWCLNINTLQDYRDYLRRLGAGDLLEQDWLRE